MNCRTSPWSRPSTCRPRRSPEFIAWAKARPNGISIGSPGPGTTPHLSGVLFAARTGVNAVHVPFRGAAQTIPAMLSGDVTFAVDNLASYISQIESGAMRALAVTSAKRWPTLPNVPTMAEAGVKDFVVTLVGRLRDAAAATPQAIVDKLVRRAQGDRRRRGVAEALPRRRRPAAAQHPGEAKAFAAKETKMWQEVVRLSGLDAAMDQRLAIAVQKKLCGSTSTSSLSVPLAFGAAASHSRR